jgi:hypothetical protein
MDIYIRIKGLTTTKYTAIACSFSNNHASVDQNHPEGSPFFFKKNLTLSNLAENSICPSHLHSSKEVLCKPPRALQKYQEDCQNYKSPSNFINIKIYSTATPII